MGQGPPPPTAEEIEAAARRAEEQARGKKEESTPHSDAPSTKKRARFFTEAEAPKMMGRYELIAEIASGGMATVFLARLRGAGGFQRLVAIKRLHPHLQHEEDFIQMFLDEARIAAQIHHAHVVPILEIASSDAEGYYLVMEYIEGITLYDVAAHASAHKDHAVPREMVLRIVPRHAERPPRRARAHRRRRDAPLGRAHRDCTPSNMLVGVDGSTRLTDFRRRPRGEPALVDPRRHAEGQGRVHGARAGAARRLRPPRRRLLRWASSSGRLLTAEAASSAPRPRWRRWNRVMTAPIPRVGQVAYGIPTARSRPRRRRPSRATRANASSRRSRWPEALEKAVGTTIASRRARSPSSSKSSFGKSLGERREAIRKWTPTRTKGARPLDPARRARALPSVPPAARDVGRGRARRRRRRRLVRRRSRRREVRTRRSRGRSRRTSRPSRRRGRGQSLPTCRRGTSRRRRLPEIERIQASPIISIDPYPPSQGGRASHRFDRGRADAGWPTGAAQDARASGLAIVSFGRREHDRTGAAAADAAAT